jgi:hypothetical protein
VHKACPPLAHPSLKVMAGTGLTLGAPCLVLTGSVACAAATLGGEQWQATVLGGAQCPQRRDRARVIPSARFCIWYTLLTPWCMMRCQTGT